MKKFIARNKYMLYLFIILEVGLLPAEILFFYKNREFIDLGLLISAILIIALSIPMFNMNRKHKEARKLYLKSKEQQKK
ncbi:MAG: hypothetical protein WCR19_02140 [Acholeplasmataceae bacterium]